MFVVEECGSATAFPYFYSSLTNSSSGPTSPSSYSQAGSSFPYPRTPYIQQSTTNLNTPKGLRYDVSQEAVSIMDVCINCFILHLFCLCGIVGNVLNIVILTHHGFTKTTNILLTSLSVSDLVFSFTQSMGRLCNVVDKFDRNLASTINSVYVVYVRTWNQVALMVSIYQVMVIALERLLAVCFPLQVSRIVTPLRMKSLIAAVYILLTVLTMPCHLMYSIEWVTYGNNVTVALFHPTSFYTDNIIGINFYVAAILSNVRSSVPLTTVSICSLVILIRLSTSSKHLDRMSSSTHHVSRRIRDVKSVRMLLAVCLVLLVFVLLPTTTFEAYISFSPDADQLSCRFKIVVMYVSNLLYQVSSSSNFVIYVTMNAKFAKTYRQLFNCNWRMSKP